MMMMMMTMTMMMTRMMKTTNNIEKSTIARDGDCAFFMGLCGRWMVPDSRGSRKMEGRREISAW